MAEAITSETDTYIKCSKCKLKYKNNDIDIAHDFGYNRLGEQFKTCVICKDKGKKDEKIARKELLTNITTKLIGNYDINMKKNLK